jgi:transcriptional regulator
MGQFNVYTATVIAKIIAMRAAGKTTTEIAASIGTTHNSLTARMSPLGISKTRKPQPQADIAA